MLSGISKTHRFLSKENLLQVTKKCLPDLNLAVDENVMLEKLINGFYIWYGMR
jgi:hypothetical protein